MKFKPGDICICDPTSRYDCFLIESVSRTSPTVEYDVISLRNTDSYYVKEERLEKIGELTPGLSIEDVKAIFTRKPVLPDQDSLDVLNGRARAKLEVERGSILDRPRWQLLAQAKPGDRITIRSRGEIEQITFHYVLERGEKYVFLGASPEGKLLRYALTSIVVPT